MASPALKSPAPRPRPVEIRTGVDHTRGYTKQPHEYEHLITGNKLSGLLQANLIYWIGRNTFGKESRPEWARLSITDLAKLCGDVERKSVAVALADLLERGIIAAPPREGCAANTPKMYKLCPENWRKAPSYKPAPDPELVKLAKAVEAGWQEEAEEEPERTVAPGKSSKPVTVAMPQKDADPFPVRIVYYCEFDEPVSFRARPGRNGRLNVTACRPSSLKPELPATPATVSPCSRTQLHAAPTFEENTELARYRAYLVPLVLDLWGTATDDAFVKLVFDAADGASLETFQAQLILKFKATDANRIDAREASKHKPGLLRNLAEQAARTHKLAQAREKERAAAMPAVTPQKPPEPLDAARRWDRIRQQLQALLTPESYANWFAFTRQAEETATSTTVIANGDHEEVEFICQEYGQMIEATCRKLGEPTLIMWRAGR